MYPRLHRLNTVSESHLATAFSSDAVEGPRIPYVGVIQVQIAWKGWRPPSSKNFWLSLQPFTSPFFGAWNFFPTKLPSCWHSEHRVLATALLSTFQYLQQVQQTQAWPTMLRSTNSCSILWIRAAKEHSHIVGSQLPSKERKLNEGKEKVSLNLVSSELGSCHTWLPSVNSSALRAV